MESEWCDWAGHLACWDVQYDEDMSTPVPATCNTSVISEYGGYHEIADHMSKMACVMNCHFGKPQRRATCKWKSAWRLTRLNSTIPLTV